MQREVQLADPTSGIVQLVRNTADAKLLGAEIEGLFQISSSLIFDFSLGLLDASYTEVLFDLNGDGVINDTDKDLKLPRAANVTYSLGLVYEADISSWGSASTRLNYAYRDACAFTDDNRDFLLDQDILNLGFDIRPTNANWTVSVYGRNPRVYSSMTVSMRKDRPS